MNQRTTLALAVGFVLLWNSGFIGAEYGLPYTGPFTLLFWRYLGLSLILLFFLLLTQRLRWVGWKVAGINMLIGILSHGVWLACVLVALDFGVPAGIVALIVALQPLATGALSGLVTGERTSMRQWLGLTAGFVGVALTVAFRIDFGSYRSVVGYLIPLGSVIGITIATLLQRRMELKDESAKLSLDMTLFLQSIATAFALAIPAILVEGLTTQWEAEFLYTLSWLVLAVSLGAYGLMWRLIARINATRTASLFYLGPPVTMFMAWLAFGDKIRVMDATGIVIVFVGVFLTQTSKNRVQTNDAVHHQN